MRKRASDEYRDNQVGKRGVVVDRDPAKARVKVRFEDEDDVQSFWVDVLARSSKGSKSYIMPELDDEVWCLIDAKGEDGCVVGSKYNAKDSPPWGRNDDVGYAWAGGSIHIDRASGAVTIETGGQVRIKGGQIVIEGDKIVLDGVVHLGGEGGPAVHRIGDVDSDGDFASSGASKVFAL